MESIVVIAASAGGLDPLRRIIGALPARCTASIFVVMHIGHHRSMLPQLLAFDSELRVVFAEDGMKIAAGHIYVAPPDRHMILVPDCIKLSSGPKIHHTRPAADPLFMSAAEVYGDRVVGIVLSGGDGDGAAGLRAIKDHGGIAFVENPEEAPAPSMPYAAIAGDHPEVLWSSEIARRVADLCSC